MYVSLRSVNFFSLESVILFSIFGNLLISVSFISDKLDIVWEVPKKIGWREKTISKECIVDGERACKGHGEG